MSEKIEHLGDLYLDSDGGFMQVIGLITDPAVILANPITGKKDVRVIKSEYFREMERVTDREALEVCIATFANDKTDKS